MNSCGIDFGTSNSTIGTTANGATKLLALEAGKSDMPTALFYSFNEDEFMFGREAVHEYIDGEFGRFMRALKSTLGTSLMEQTTQIKTQNYDFISLISIYLKELKTRAEKQTQSSLESAVIGRPVHFVDNHPANDSKAQEQLKQAALKAGFKHIEFQYEPIAAALDFEQTLQTETLALIADIGGGTSDFTLIRLSPNQPVANRKNDILATTGVHIGGTDIDRELNLQTAMPLFGFGSKFNDVDMHVPAHLYHSLATWHLINFLYNEQTLRDVTSMKKRMNQPEMATRLVKVLEDKLGHYISFQTEKAKIDLSENSHHNLSLKHIEAGLETLIQRNDFEDLLRDNATKIQASAYECLQQAQVKPEEIGAIFLTGGTTSIPMIRDHLIAVCPNAKIALGDKFGSVGTGLALHASRIFSV